MINLQMARAYLSATDPAAAARTWQFVIDEAAKTKHKATLDRWRVAMRDPHFDPLRSLPVVQTRPEQSLKALQEGTVATNV